MNKAKERVYLTQDKKKQEAAIVDIDGTIALMNGRGIHESHRVDEDVVNKPVADMVDFMYHSGVKIILITGRKESCKRGLRP